MPFSKEAILHFNTDHEKVGTAVLIKPDIALTTRHQYLWIETCKPFVATEDNRVRSYINDGFIHPELDMVAMILSKPLSFDGLPLMKGQLDKKEKLTLACYPAFVKRNYIEIPVFPLGKIFRNISLYIASKTDTSDMGDVLYRLSTYLGKRQHNLNGASGGAVVSETGELVAMNTGSEVNEMIGVGISAKNIANFLDFLQIESVRS